MDKPGAVLKQWRKDLNESREAFAHRVGCTMQTIARWEKDVRPIPITALARLQQLANETGAKKAAAQFAWVIQSELKKAAMAPLIDSRFHKLRS